MYPYAKATVAVVLVFLCVDFIWLSEISADFYRQNIGAHLAGEPNLGAAAVFYVVYLTGLMFFAVVPAMNRGTISSAAFSGALFGLVTYGTYDLTNMATMSDWPLSVTAVDMCWGMFISAFSAIVGYWVGTNSIRSEMNG
jgi:uncharacterized membrane protein